ncbi:MAG: methyltransferase, partial [Dehalococcoidia bacterium]|nr:methyltransferase [Dehalococcoidia bacterium]
MAPETQPDPYFRKGVSLALDGERLEFEVGHTLFASHEVDAGTKLLLRCLEVDPPPRRILDLGCGYGVLGIALARRFPE